MSEPISGRISWQFALFQINHCVRFSNWDVLQRQRGRSCAKHMRNLTFLHGFTLLGYVLRCSIFSLLIWRKRERASFCNYLNVPKSQDEREG
jgi:hypothetical protein